MEAPQVKNHRKPFREKSISNRGTTRSRGAGLFSWAVDAITRNVKPIPNPATRNLSNPTCLTDTLSQGLRPSKSISASTPTRPNKLSSQSSKDRTNARASSSGQDSVGASTQGSSWLFVVLAPRLKPSKRMVYAACLLIFLPLRVLGILSRLLALTIILLPVALVLDTALSAPYLYFKYKLKGWK
jgi:hypothetical protein